MEDPPVKKRPLMETRGELVCFEVCKGNLNAIKRLGFMPEARYLLTSVYAVDGADLGLHSFEWYGASRTISELVDKYIKNSPSIVFIRKTPYPVRNMLYRHAVLGYEPLNEEEMVEFKRLLLSRDPERFALSFSGEIIIGRSANAQKTDAQRAAEHDMAFGKLTPHMADYYDNEHQADMRNRNS